MQTAMEQTEGKFAEHVKKTPCKILFNEGSVLITTCVGITSRHLDTSVATETTAYDYPVAELLQIAIRGKYPKNYVSRKHILLEVDDWLKQRLVFTNKDYQEMSDNNKKLWFQETSFCICVSDPEKHIRYQVMFEKLNKYFGDRLNIYGDYEKRKVKCYTLLRTSKVADVVTRINPVYSKDSICMLDSKLSDFADLLNNSYNNLLEYPIVDETNFLKNVTIQIGNDLSNVEVINNELQKYNLKLVEAVRDTEMVVIRSTA